MHGFILGSARPECPAHSGLAAQPWPRLSCSDLVFLTMAVFRLCRDHERGSLFEAWVNPNRTLVVHPLCHTPAWLLQGEVRMGLVQKLLLNPGLGGWSPSCGHLEL